VPVDEVSYRRYQSLPESPLRTLINENLELAPTRADDKKPSPFAIIRMTSANDCPMLSEDRLCSIQSAYGASLLSHTCATFPRIVHTNHGSPIVALTLSCPEAARLVLLDPNLFERTSGSGQITDLRAPDSVEDSAWSSPLAPWTEPIRSIVLTTIVNRSYPLWQRLFLLGIFATRLDGLVSGDLAHHPGAFLAGFNATIAKGSLRPAMDALPANETAQMDALLQLAGLMLHSSNITPRFAACVNSFTNGLGNGPGATLDSLTAHARAAHHRYFAPFLRRNPHVLENYLINTVLRLNFPFGSNRDPEEVQQPMSRRFAVLAGQFALIRGLLIGVAGHYREQFAQEHVVHTVQSASRHFEHHPTFEKKIFSLLAELKLDQPYGLSALLREPMAAPVHDTPIQPGLPSKQRLQSGDPFAAS